MAPKPDLLTLGDVVTRMRRQAREVHALHGLLFREELGDRLGIPAVLAQPHVQRAQAAQREIAVERASR